jgi:cadmium resistance protein CadD (predicted permease)
MILDVVVAGIVFAATDVDDLFVLIGFFADPRLRVGQVVLGQYLGIGTLFGASIAVALAAVVIPPAYVGLLGLIPIAIGAKSLWELWRGGDDDARGHTAGGVLSVAGVTIANGGDNVGVYVPLFATRELDELAIYAVVFAAMTGRWCWAAHRLASHPEAGAPIRRFAPVAVPLVLIALGLWILYEGASYRLLG